MSCAATRFVWDNLALSGRDLLIALAVADEADDDGVAVFAGPESLAKKVRLAPDAITAALNGISALRSTAGDGLVCTFWGMEPRASSPNPSPRLDATIPIAYPERMPKACVTIDRTAGASSALYALDLEEPLRRLWLEFGKHRAGSAPAIRMQDCLFSQRSVAEQAKQLVRDFGGSSVPLQAIDQARLTLSRGRSIARLWPYLRAICQQIIERTPTPPMEIPNAAAKPAQRAAWTPPPRPENYSNKPVFSGQR